MEIVQNLGDTVVLKVVYNSARSMEASATFAFGRSEVVEVKPHGTVNRFHIASPLQYGVSPPLSVTICS